MKNTLKTAFLSFAALLAAGIAGYLLLINPDNLLVRLFQRKISDIDARVIVGPYPVESDLRLLKSHDVTLIVSLLDPAIPYEKTLLEKERVLAAKHGLRLESFPMSSILGQKFGEHYDQSAKQAAAIIANTQGKVYLHCYLGLHRVRAVNELLIQKGVDYSAYSVRRAEREKDRLCQDEADAAYQSGRYAEALAALAAISPQKLTPQAKLLRAWSHYRLGHFDDAAAIFDTLRAAAPNDPAAIIGAGYCALNSGRAKDAEMHFVNAIRLQPDNSEALGGLGLTCYRQGRLDEAARHLEAALLLSPSNQELKDALAHIRDARR